MAGETHGGRDRPTSDEPVIDGRGRDDVLEQMRAIAPHYVPGWEPESPDAGTALFEIFADLAEDVIERLDKLPEKHRMAFLDMIDFTTYPPQPARLPLQFVVSESADGNVVVPAGTTVAADETENRPEKRFETTADRFEVTPAHLTTVYGVDPGTDRIVDHDGVIEGTEPISPFAGANLQEHVLYVGHESLLQLNPGATIDLEVATNAPETVLRDDLIWEYHGEVDDEEGWHPLVTREEASPRTIGFSEVRAVNALLERSEAFLERNGYRRTEAADEQLLVRSVADDVRKGRFGTDPTLPPALLEGESIDPDVETKLLPQLNAMRERFRAAATSDAFDGTDDDSEQFTLRFEIPGELTEVDVDGIESRWLRCRIPEGELSSALFSITIDSIGLAVGTDETEDSSGLAPDEVFRDDVPLSFEGERPQFLLGQGSYPTEVFALACEEVLTKRGATVEVSFQGGVHQAEPRTDENAPEISWEYWDGDGWRRLDVTDTTHGLQTTGSVTFDVPVDIETTEVVGHEYHWIQGRLAEGHYGEPRVEQTDEDTWERVTDHITPPNYTDVRLSYSQGVRSFEHVVRTNNLTSRREPTDGESIRPFVPPPGRTQALYLGFDAPLCNGPIPLYVSLEGVVRPDGFNPWITVEYCPDPAATEWDRLTVSDGTEDLTERGVIELTFPEPSVPLVLFGEERHWIRLRVTGEEFFRSDDALFAEVATDGDATGSGLAPGVGGVPNWRDGNERTPPEIDGLYLNTHRAENRQQIVDERIGSSDGTANQRFTFSNTPVLEPDLWVEESDAITESDRRQFRETRPDAIREHDDSDECWVRWSEVPDFFDSGPTSRHYVLDRSAGTVTFGDGKRGVIPPSGTNNLTADYRTGGGTDGDVPAGSVTTLKDSLTFVDAVTNPEPGEGGEDEEPLEELVERAPKQLRDRDKPVTKDGFERIARSTSRELAKVRCESGLDDAGERTPGHLTLIVVPDSEEVKPTPSVELLSRLEGELREQAPATLGGGSHSGLTVRGPNFVEVSVEATVTASGSVSVTELKEHVERELTAFVHPTSGGPRGDGWEIGVAPTPSVFSAHLERLEDVIRVENISVTFTDDGEQLTIAGDERPPTVAPDVLIYSGRHDVTVLTTEES